MRSSSTRSRAMRRSDSGLSSQRDTRSRMAIEVFL